MTSTQTDPISARFALKAATSEAHERLDSRLSLLDLARPRDYMAFLLAQAAAFLPVEAALEAAEVEGLIHDWPERRRSAALCSDLTTLGLTPPPPVAVPPIRGEAAVLGATYVLEGSRLGGAMLLRRVPDSMPKAFLGAGNPKLWRAFVTDLDQRLSSPTDIVAASAAASSVFEAFASSASDILETTGRA